MVGGALVTSRNAEITTAQFRGNCTPSSVSPHKPPRYELLTVIDITYRKLSRRGKWRKRTEELEGREMKVGIVNGKVLWMAKVDSCN